MKDLLNIEDGGQEILTFPGGFSCRNVALFLEKVSFVPSPPQPTKSNAPIILLTNQDLPNIPRHESELNGVSYQHGDLNGGNILIDANHNVWLIDFAVNKKNIRSKEMLMLSPK